MSNRAVLILNYNKKFVLRFARYTEFEAAEVFLKFTDTINTIVEYMILENGDEFNSSMRDYCLNSAAVFAELYQNQKLGIIYMFLDFSALIGDDDDSFIYDGS
nr:hypothetical protein Iba_scaffold2417CG0040 [Ipomoea batatas]